jgi:hypothetical protein
MYSTCSPGPFRLAGQIFIILFLFEMMPARAQLSGDPAQAGAFAYCEVRNQGRSEADALQYATQIMAETLMQGAGPLAAGLQVNNPALLERWRYLVESLCQESSVPGSGLEILR